MPMNGGVNSGELGKPWGQAFAAPQSSSIPTTAVPNTPPGAPQDLRQVQQNAQKQPIVTPSQLMQPGMAGGQASKPGVPPPNIATPGVPPPPAGITQQPPVGIRK